jgi:hypothetical protein
MFTETNQDNPDSVIIFYVITVDPSKSTNPFVSINSVSHFQVEDEAHSLFDPHSLSNS